MLTVAIPMGQLCLYLPVARLSFLILERKRSLGEGGCDPTIQASISMRQGWIQKQVSLSLCLSRSFLKTFVAGGDSGQMLLSHFHRHGWWRVVVHPWDSPDG